MCGKKETSVEYLLSPFAIIFLVWREKTEAKAKTGYGYCHWLMPHFYNHSVLVEWLDLSLNSLMGTFYFLFFYIYFFSLNLQSITLFGHLDNRFLLKKIQKNPILFRVRKEADGPKNRVPEPILVKQIPTKNKWEGVVLVGGNKIRKFRIRFSSEWLN